MGCSVGYFNEANCELLNLNWRFDNVQDMVATSSYRTWSPFLLQHMVSPPSCRTWSSHLPTGHGHQTFLQDVATALFIATPSHHTSCHRLMAPTTSHHSLAYKFSPELYMGDYLVTSALSPNVAGTVTMMEGDPVRWGNHKKALLARAVFCGLRTGSQS